MSGLVVASILEKGTLYDNGGSALLLQQRGFSRELIEKFLTPIGDGWHVHDPYSEGPDLRIEHTIEGLACEFVVNLQDGGWVLFDVGSDFTRVDGGDGDLGQR